jgi:hypothetical protein
MVEIIMIASILVAYTANYHPKILSNHIPHILMPKKLADKWQKFVEGE